MLLIELKQERLVHTVFNNVLNSCLPVKLNVKLVQSSVFLPINLPANNILDFEYFRFFISQDIYRFPHVYSDATPMARPTAHIHHAFSSTDQ
jgi:hypothetical protein